MMNKLYLHVDEGKRKCIIERVFKEYIYRNLKSSSQELGEKDILEEAGIGTFKKIQGQI